MSYVFRWKSTDVLVEHVASILKVKNKANEGLCLWVAVFDFVLARDYFMIGPLGCWIALKYNKELHWIITTIFIIGFCILLRVILNYK
jgi:hypothetical protein